MVDGDLRAAVQRVVPRLRGSYALLLMSADAPDTLVATRVGPPLVIGVGIGVADGRMARAIERQGRPSKHLRARIAVHGFDAPAAPVPAGELQVVVVRGA